MNSILGVILLVVLLFIAAFTAASEISLIAANRIKLRRLAQEGSKTAKIVLKILETPEKFLGTILVVNNVVDTLIAAIVTAMMISIISGEGVGIVLATVIAAFLIIVFEVAAKTLAVERSERLSLYMARPVRALIAAFSPIVKILAVVTNFIINIITGGRPRGKPTLITEEEIKAIIKMGEEEGVLHKEKYKMLSNVFDFSETLVKDVMTPSKDVFSIDGSASLDDILYKVLESGYSRIPVYKDNPDNIVGLINMKDLLNLSVNKDLVVLQDIVYPTAHVPVTKKVSDLLREFQKGHTHLAVVVDDRDKVLGIITLEDLLEEIVGEIEDESDVRATYYKKQTG